jgi:putative transcriptional regulator
MTVHNDELLACHALGILDEADAAEAQDLLDTPEHREAFDEFTLAAHAMALQLAPDPPPASIRARMLGSTATENRFAEFAGQVARLLDYTQGAADALLRRIDDAASWVVGPSPGSHLVHFDPGPSLGTALTGFVRIQAGAPFPEHEHVGYEQVLIFQGAYRDSDGTIFKRGDLVENEHGSEHSFAALAGPDLIYLVILGEGIKIGGVLLEI